MAEHSENSYRSIMKGISIFGGVKMFEILINLLRGKLVALFLGPVGMGITSVFNNASNTLSQFASLGLNLGVVKEVAASKEDPDKTSLIIALASRLFTITALIGAIVCIILAPWLSDISFGSREYAWQFVMLALAIFMIVANNGKLSLLQGLHDVKGLSKASLVGSLTGLLIGVPLYYFFGNKGIVPAIIALNLSLYIFYSLQLRRAGFSRSASFSWRRNRELLRHLISLGIVMVMTSLIGSLSNYVLIIFLRKLGGLDDVGLFNAANSVTNQFAGMVFSAMALDYFPRLSACASDNSQVRVIVNRQSELVAWIIAPISIALIIFSPLVVKILFTDSFTPVIPLLRLMAIGVMMKAFAYSTGYISFAKGDKKTFFILEGLVLNILMVSLGIIGFYFFGLIGMGYAFIAEHTISLIAYYFVTRRLYQYDVNPAVARSYAVAFVMVTVTFGCYALIPGIPGVVLSSILFALILAISFYNIRSLIKK